MTQRSKGGISNIDNYLPACTSCNRLRWGREGDKLREVLLMGLIAVKEMKKGSVLDEELTTLKEKRVAENRRRRFRQSGRAY